MARCFVWELARGFDCAVGLVLVACNYRCLHARRKLSDFMVSGHGKSTDKVPACCGLYRGGPLKSAQPLGLGTLASMALAGYLVGYLVEVLYIAWNLL
jgi:hypothetical protein